MVNGIADYANCNLFTTCTRLRNRMRAMQIARNSAATCRQLQAARVAGARIVQCDDRCLVGNVNIRAYKI